MANRATGSLLFCIFILSTLIQVGCSPEKGLVVAYRKQDLGNNGINMFIDVKNITTRTLYNVRVFYYSLEPDGTTLNSSDTKGVGFGTISPGATITFEDNYLFSKPPAGINVKWIFYTDTPDIAIEPKTKLTFEMIKNGLK